MLQLAVLYSTKYFICYAKKKKAKKKKTFLVLSL